LSGAGFLLKAGIDAASLKRGVAIACAIASVVIKYIKEILL
jgi:hypothetical protein